MGEPFEVYGRMYYDPKTKKRVFPESKPKKQEGGFIEAELGDLVDEPTMQRLKKIRLYLKRSLVMKKYKVVALPKRFEGGDGGGTYTVKDGDTFRGIANRLRIPYKDLEKANPGINMMLLQ